MLGWGICADHRSCVPGFRTWALPPGPPGAPPAARAKHLPPAPEGGRVPPALLCYLSFAAGVPPAGLEILVFQEPRKEGSRPDSQEGN